MTDRRHDLLQLEDDDLAAISNRGNVNRAKREMAKGELTVEIQEFEGTVTFNWSDDVKCIFPADKTLAESRCSCPATTVCRHLIRSVLAYQDTHEDVAAERPILQPWNPGGIEDDVMADVFGAGSLRRAKQLFEDGVVAELVQSTRPSARFHGLGHTVRFMVENDPRYTQCDCQERAPCTHAAMAIYAFRGLDAESGLLDTKPTQTFDNDLLERVENGLIEICVEGISNVTSARADRLNSLENQLRDAGLTWPASIVGDVRRQHEYYHNHDARFSPDLLAELIGELLIRLDALKNPKLPIPQLFVGGSQQEIETKLGQSRLVGLGCIAVRRQKSVELSALLQDTSSGKVVALSRSFANPVDEDEPQDYAVLGNRLAVKGRSLSAIGRGQLVIKGAKLNAGHRIEIGRTTASVYAQKYTWEDLRPPAHVMEVREISARLESLPPASLRPRRVGEDFFVLPVADVRNVRFSSRAQAVKCDIVDSVGGIARMQHDFETRNQTGTERLLNWLTKRPHDVRYIAAIARQTAAGLELRPTAVVFEVDGARVMVQPWVDDMDDHLEVAETKVSDTAAIDALVAFRKRLGASMGTILVSGLLHSAGLAGRLERLSKSAESLELAGLSHFLHRFSESLGSDSARDELATTLVWSRLAMELS